jgi:hypothetical protein
VRRDGLRAEAVANHAEAPAETGRGPPSGVTRAARARRAVSIRGRAARPTRGSAGPRPRTSPAPECLCGPLRVSAIRSHPAQKIRARPQHLVGVAVATTSPLFFIARGEPRS